MFNILFTSAGRRVELIRNFRKSMLALNLKGAIVAADRQETAAAFDVADKVALVPSISEPTYINTLLQICKTHHIQLLIPLIDTELLLLSENIALFEKEGVRVLVSSQETNQLCYDKRLTAAFFESKTIRTPSIYNISEALNNPDFIYPCFLKPARGSRSIGAHKIHNKNELLFYSQHIDEPILQEYIDGKEYTLDILLNFKGELLCIVPRLRMETRSGEISKGLTVRDPAIIQAATEVIQKLPGLVVGCITLQCIVNNTGDIYFIEINPRFGGGYPLSYAAGADYPKALIQMCLNQKVGLSQADWRHHKLMLRYDDAFYRDL
jgi:carbamoyl-phosphate synthase large subunit